MREGAKRREQETRRPAASHPFPRGTHLASLCAAVAISWLAFGDYPSQADDFQHELAAAQLFETSVLANQSKQPGAKAGEEDRENLKKVEKVFVRLVTRHPRNAEAHAAYARYLWETDDETGAMAQWQAAWNLDPRDAATACHLGECYMAKGDAKETVEYFTTAASLNPREPLYHFNLGNATFVFRRIMPGYRGLGEEAVLETALSEFRKASDLDPFNVEYARAYAETFYGLKQPDWTAALDAWSHFLELKGPRDFCYANLARVNLKLGRKTEALEDLDKVTRPDFDTVKNHLLKEAREP